MQRQQFDYQLPKELIAQYPSPERSQSRLMVVGAEVHTGQEGREDKKGQKHRQIEHRQFQDFYQLLNAGDLLVFNNTKVMPARLYGHKRSGGKIEILVERLIDDNLALAQVRASRSPKAGSSIVLEAGGIIEVTGRQDTLFELRSSDSWLSIMAEQGHMPLPPYMERGNEPADWQRYQTVYAQQMGAVAAPTAGLHFDEDYRQRLQQAQVNIAEVTLHVGAGTYQPVRVDNIEDHQIHTEWMEIDEATCDLINTTKTRGGRVVAVGTTSVRVLESAASNQKVSPYKGETDIFIYPGYQFQVVDAMLTNFHLPESSLLMLVSAFRSRETIMNAYQQAIDESYRFYSYGDAMFLS